MHVITDSVLVRHLRRGWTLSDLSIMSSCFNEWGLATYYSKKQKKTAFAWSPLTGFAPFQAPNSFCSNKHRPSLYVGWGWSPEMSDVTFLLQEELVSQGWGVWGWGCSMKRGVRTSHRGPLPLQLHSPLHHLNMALLVPNAHLQACKLARTGSV